MADSTHVELRKIEDYVRNKAYLEEISGNECKKLRLWKEYRNF